jgi:hypothetical protein
MITNHLNNQKYNSLIKKKKLIYEKTKNCFSTVVTKGNIVLKFKKKLSKHNYEDQQQLIFHTKSSLILKELLNFTSIITKAKINNEKQTSIDNLLNSNIILQTKCEELEAELKETQNELLEQLKKQEEDEQEDAEQDDEDAEQDEKQKQDDNDAEQNDEDEEQDDEEQNDDEEQEQEVEYEIITINKKSYALNPITKQLFDYNEDEGFDEDAPIGIYDEKKNKIVAK